jgi:hypothetical protein
MPEQSARSLIYGRRFGVNRPMDLNALIFCAWMMKKDVPVSRLPLLFPWLIVGLAP